MECYPDAPPLDSYAIATAGPGAVAPVEPAPPHCVARYEECVVEDEVQEPEPEKKKEKKTKKPKKPKRRSTTKAVLFVLGLLILLIGAPLAVVGPSVSRLPPRAAAAKLTPLLSGTVALGLNVTVALMLISTSQPLFVVIRLLLLLLLSSLVAPIVANALAIETPMARVESGGRLRDRIHLGALIVIAMLRYSNVPVVWDALWRRGGQSRTGAASASAAADAHAVSVGVPCPALPLLTRPAKITFMCEALVLLPTKLALLALSGGASGLVMSSTETAVVSVSIVASMLDLGLTMRAGGRTGDSGLQVS